MAGREGPRGGFRVLASAGQRQIAGAEKGATGRRTGETTGRYSRKPGRGAPEYRTGGFYGLEQNTGRRGKEVKGAKMNPTSVLLYYSCMPGALNEHRRATAAVSPL